MTRQHRPNPLFDSAVVLFDEMVPSTGSTSFEIFYRRAGVNGTSSIRTHWS
jgi:hypothetical protein